MYPRAPPFQISEYATGPVNCKSAICRQQVTKSLKLAADLLDLSVWRCDKQTFLVENMFPRGLGLISAQTLSATLSPVKIEGMERGLYWCARV